MTTLTCQKISAFRLLPPNNLCLQFSSGIELEVSGDNEQFESWQLQAMAEDESVRIIVAGPGDQLTRFE